MQDIGTVAGHAFSRGNGINDLGQVVGQSGTLGAGQIAHAFLWSASGGCVISATLPAGNEIASANDINELGQVVGGRAAPRAASAASSGPKRPGCRRCRRWQAAAARRQTPSTILARSSARAVPAAPSAAPSCGTVPARSSISAHWAATPRLRTGSMTPASWSELPTRPLPVPLTCGAAPPGMQDLNTLIDPASGWRLFEALDINAAGQIVGYGSRGRPAPCLPADSRRGGAGTGHLGDDDRRLRPGRRRDAAAQTPIDQGVSSCLGQCASSSPA